MIVGAGLYMYVVVVQKFTFAISSPYEFFLLIAHGSLRAVAAHSRPIILEWAAAYSD